MAFAAVMAGGTGTRMGADIPKQYLMLGDCPIIIHTLKAFLNCSKIEKTVVMCPESYRDYTKELVEKYLAQHKDKIFICAGGDTRALTLQKSVDFIIENFGAGNKTVILTHDAVRPFLTEQMIENNIEAALEYGACNTVIPATDTITISSDGRFIEHTPDRQTVFHSQTPQSFTVGEYLDSVKKLENGQLAALTDACSLFTMTGKKVFMVKGDSRNIKITRPADLEYARQIGFLD